MEEIITVFSKGNILVRKTCDVVDEDDIWETIFEKNYSDCCSSLEDLENCKEGLYTNSIKYFRLITRKGRDHEFINFRIF